MINNDKKFPRDSNYEKDGIGYKVFDAEHKEELGRIEFVPEVPEWEAANFFLYLHDNYLEPEPDPQLLLRYNRLRQYIGHNKGWWMNPNKVLDAYKIAKAKLLTEE